MLHHPRGLDLLGRSKKCRTEAVNGLIELQRCIAPRLPATAGNCGICTLLIGTLTHPWHVPQQV